MEITMQNRFQITPVSEALKGLGTHVVYDVQGYYKSTVAPSYEEAVHVRDSLRRGGPILNSLRPIPPSCGSCNSLAAAVW